MPQLAQFCLYEDTDWWGFEGCLGYERWAEVFLKIVHNTVMCHCAFFFHINKLTYHQQLLASTQRYHPTWLPNISTHSMYQQSNKIMLPYIYRERANLTLVVLVEVARFSKSLSRCSTPTSSASNCARNRTEYMIDSHGFLKLNTYRLLTRYVQRNAWTFYR